MASNTWRDADLAFINGRVLTVNRGDDVAEAVAVAGNRIVRVGSNESVQALVGNETRVVNLAGRALTPGFVENHMHIINAVEDRKWIDVTPEVASSIDAIAAAVKERVDQTPAGELIVGWGFDHHRLRERRYPTRRDLDPVSPDHPVLLRQRESMSWTANTAALRRMGIETTPRTLPADPCSGTIRGRRSGPCGTTAGWCTSFPPSRRRRWKSWRRATGGRAGTSTASASPAWTRPPSATSRSPTRGSSCASRGGLTARIYLNIYPVYGTQWDVETAAYSIFRSGMRTGFGDDWVRLGPAVIGIDGGVQGQTAALFEPYSNDPEGKFRGSFRCTQEMADEFCLEAHKAGFQIAAIPHGDHGITVTLDAIEKAQRAHPRPDPRHRLEHAYLWNAELLDRAAGLGVVYNAQPPILEVLGEACTLEPWGEERSRYAFPMKSLLDRGVISSGGSDMPIVTANPMVGVDCLVNRRLDPSPEEHGAEPR